MSTAAVGLLNRWKTAFSQYLHGAWVRQHHRLRNGGAAEFFVKFSFCHAAAGYFVNYYVKERHIIARKKEVINKALAAAHLDH